MKNLLFGVSVALLLVSCNKNGEQIEAAKQKLASLGEDKAVIEKLDFKVHEVFDKDVYEKIQKLHNKRAEDLADVGAYEQSSAELKKVSDYLDLEDKAQNKTFYIVDAYRVEGDTLDKSHFYIDDKNHVLDFVIVK